MAFPSRLWILIGLMLGSAALAADDRVLLLQETASVHAVGPVTDYWHELDAVSAKAVFLGEHSIPWQRSGDKVINIGYSEDAYWFRFTVKNLTRAEDWYFLLDLSLIRAIDIYEVRQGKLENFYHLGDRFEFDARPVDHRNFVVPLTLQQGEMMTLYARIASDYSVQFPGYIMEKKRFLKHEITTHLMHGAFFGFLVVMIFYNGFLFFSTRDLSYFFYVCFTASLGLFQFAQHGFGFQYLWPTGIWFQHRAVPLLGSTSFVFGALFVQAFLDTRNRSPLFHRYINWFMATALVFLVVALFVSEFFAQIVNAYLAMIGAILLFVTAIHCWQQGAQAARFFVVAWLLFLVATIIFAGNKMGLFPRNLLTEYGMQIGTAIELSLLSFALADRINQSRRKQEELLAQSQVYEQIAKSANERALNFERMSKQRLEKNMKSRTEQLQNALKELTAANRQLEEMSTFDSLTGVRNLNYLNDKLQEEWTRAVRDKTWLSLALVSVDEYDIVADRYGYVAAEEILKSLAHAMTERVARPADVVARTANAEFAVVMPNTAPEGAGHVAQAIYNFVASEPLNLGVCSVSVTVSVSVLSRQPVSNDGWLDYLSEAQSLLIEVIENGGDHIRASESASQAD